MANRDSFVFYRSFYNAIVRLPAQEAHEVMLAICEYALNQQESSLDGVPAIVFDLIKPQLEASYKNWVKASKPRKKPNDSKDVAEPQPIASQTLAESQPNASRLLAKAEPNANNVNDNVNVNDNDNVNANENDNVLDAAHQRFQAWKNSNKNN